MDKLSSTLEKIRTSEQDKFRTLCDQFDKKEWKKAFKTANDILAVVPDQPDTLSVLGIIYYNAPEEEGGDKAKANEYIRKGLLGSKFQSHICWYIFGLYNRAEGQFREAAKCFRSALKGDSDNITVNDELAALETQIGDYAGLLETRKTLLRLNPKTHITWVAAALAAQLAGDQGMAVRLLEAAIRDFRTACATKDERLFPGPGALTARKKRERANMWLDSRYTLQEMHNFMALVYEEQGKASKALEYLAANEHELPDKLGLREAKARLNLKIGEWAKAESLYRELVKINPDCAEYHKGLMGALKIEESDREAVRKHAEWMVKECPKSLYCKVFRLSVNVEDEERFREYLNELLAEYFERGVPSMFQALKGTIASKTNLLTIADEVAIKLSEQKKEEVVVAEQKNNEQKENVASEQKENEEKKEEVSKKVEVVEEIPAHILALHFAAQTASALGKHDLAKERIEAAIASFPDSSSSIDLLTAKARVLRHAGDVAGAADAYEAARKLDTADRYLNNRASKYLIRAGRIDEAIANITHFIRKGAGPTEGVLARYQCVWFEYEMGRYLYEKGDYARALKNFLLVVKDYQEYRRSLNDFHFFVFRKGTVVSYYKLIKTQFNTVENFPKYASAVAYAVRIYIDVAANKAEKYSKAVELLPVKKTRKHAGNKKLPFVPVAEDRDPVGEYYINTVGEPLKEAKRLLEGLPKKMPVKDVEGVVEDVFAASAELACADKNKEEAEKALNRLKEYNSESKFLPKIEELIKSL